MATESRPGLRVLVAEDSIASRQALTSLLKRFGPFELVQVNDGQAALHELESGSFTLLLTDRDMPNLNGIELIRKAREDKRLQQLPIILISTRTTKTNVLEALDAGASDYVIKPFDSDVMLHRIQYLMQAKSARPELAPEKIDALPNPVTQGDIDALLYPGKRMVGPSETLSEDEFYDMMKTSVEQVDAASGNRSKRGHVMAQEEIDAILTAEDDGSTSKEGSTMSKQRTRPGKPIITYDFKHPMRVSRDQQRTLENLHSHLSRTLASAFSTIQRSVVDCDIAFVDQTTYAEFIMSLSNPSCSYTFHIEPLGGPAIIDFSLPIAYAFIDRAYGGGKVKLPPKKARPMTRLERGVMGRVVVRALANLEATWEALLKVQITDAELETNPEFMQIASPSDTVILIAFEVNMQHASGLVNLCYPYFTLEPIMSYLNVQTWASRERGRHIPKAPHRNYQQILRSVQADITAVCARGRVSADKIARLSVGDTLILQTKTDDPSVVFVEDQPVFFARSGKSERDQYAVRLMRTIPPERVHHHR